MKKIAIILTLSFITVFGFNGQSQIVVKVKPARPKVIVAKPKKAKRGHHWVGGHWRWSKRKGKYVWVKGHWQRNRKGKRWVPGHWGNRQGGHVWIPGHWK